MCSIFGILGIKSKDPSLRQIALEMSRKLRHRGPDCSGIHESERAIIAHERLAIVGINNGTQPLYSPNKKNVLAVNGEIYNHKEIRSQYEGRYPFQTDSDCEVILALYEDMGIEFLEKINGIFAFILYDEEREEYLVGRDHIGIVPLYQGLDKRGNHYVASEMKALVNVCETVSEFPPGSYYSSRKSEPVRYYLRDWNQYAAVQNNISDKEGLTKTLESAVERQLMADVPYGVLLSGGLDSSIIAAVTKRLVTTHNTEDSSEQPQLHSFAIGLEGAPDLRAAREVSKKIGTIHHEITYSIQEGLDAIHDVIYHVETYDVTTIRASTPMFLMAKKIKEMGVKMVLSGEGADEIFGGYLYFHKAPNAGEFHEETVRKLLALNMFDCARANKSLAAWGVEGRVPFLDKDFIDAAMRINPKEKMCNGDKIEKHILRECFEHYLPNSVAWRQKEQFSDGVGYSWIDALKGKAEERVTGQQMKNASCRFPHNTPTTKEAYIYREIFEELFPLESAVYCVPGDPSVACSSAKAMEWDDSFKEMVDASGRAVKGVHKNSYW